MKVHYFENDTEIDKDKNIISGDKTSTKNSKIFVQNDSIRGLHSEVFSINKKIKSLKSIVMENLINESGEKYRNLRVNIVTWADVDKTTFMCWGDYWVKNEMNKELELLGCKINNDMLEADITIYLFGSPFNYRPMKPYMYNPMSYNILWLYSHPMKINKYELLKYDYVFCLSKFFLDKLKTMYSFVHDEPLYGCTNFKVPKKSKYGTNNDLIMVANARGDGAPYGRKIIKYLVSISSDLKKYRIKVWGHKWSNFVRYNKFPKEWYIDKYWPYSELPILYRNSRAVLIDGYEDMATYGFVQMKVFDVFASGGLPIVQYNVGIDDIFGENVVLQFKDSVSLKNCIDVLEDENECKRRIKIGKKIANSYTYKKTVLAILDAVYDNVLEEDDIRFISKNKILESKNNPMNLKILEKYYPSVKRNRKIIYLADGDNIIEKQR